MKKMFSLIVLSITLLSMTACMDATKEITVKQPAKPQNVQVFSTNNKDGKITPSVISNAMENVGLLSAGNNDMNKPFSQRFPKLHYKTYNLAMFQNDKLTVALIKKYPNFGALAPLTMSIWEDEENIHIATLTLTGMSRASGIPMNDPDLIAYAELIHKGLKTALPNGEYKFLDYDIKSATDSYAITFEMEVPEDTEDLEEFKEDFEAEFEGEMEPIGFLMPNYSNLQDDVFQAAGYNEYDFYVTYSICKFDVIYPVSKLHPEAGAYAPCSMYMYKKKLENKMMIGYLGVNNWIKTLDIEDQESVTPLLEAQQMINDILTELTE